MKYEINAMKYILFILFFILYTDLCYSQLIADQKEIKLGDYGCLWISTQNNEIKDLNELRINGRIEIDDIYLYFPEKFDVPSNYNIISQSLERDEDLQFSFSIEIKKEQDDPFSDNIFYLCGNALAGKDSICNITFIDIRINNIEIEDFQTKVLIESENHSIPYIRYQNNQPEFRIMNNPVQTTNIYLNLLLFETSDIQFYIYNIIGECVYNKYLLDVSKYTDQIILDDVFLASGVYYLAMKINDTAITRNLIITR